MDKEVLREFLSKFQKGEIGEEDMLQLLSSLPYQILDRGICIDTHRDLRCGHPEVIYGEHKDLSQLLSIVSSFPPDSPLLITRVSDAKGYVLEREVKGGMFLSSASLFVKGKEIDISPPWKEEGDLLIITAGSSDLPVALEAYGCARFLGMDVGIICDVGIAGIHRLFPHMDKIKRARVLIVIAGMEGALPGVLAGITDRPILAVPTSVGYGTSFAGIAPLLSMLNSCAGGIGVVNIDNGFGAALLAWRIFHSFGI